MFQTYLVKIDGILFLQCPYPFSPFIAITLYNYWIGHRPWDNPLFDTPLRKEYCGQIKCDILKILRWILIPENLTHLKQNTLSESINNGSSISSYNIFVFLISPTHT